MSKDHSCPECGARLAAAATQCDLCGTPVETAADVAAVDVEAAGVEVTDVAAEAGEVAEVDVPVEASTPAEEPAATDAPLPPSPTMPATAAPPSAAKGSFCNQCGWRNPPGARFCSSCGSRLQEVDPSVAVPAAAPPSASPASEDAGVSARAEEASSSELPAGEGLSAPAPAEDPSQAEQPPQEKSAHNAVTRQVGIIIGAGTLLVIALFLVTAVSKNPVSSPVPAGVPEQAAAAPVIQQQGLPSLAPQLVEQVEALEAEIAQLDGEARLAKQRELVDLLFAAGRLDRAALEQQKVAEAQDLTNDWKRAGDLYYDWMMGLEGSRKAEVALQAVDAYQRVLAVDPANLDVRTDMATAYLNSNNAMQGVQEIQRVLSTDSTHVQALFNYGVMLAMIGRREKALEQFERVKVLEDPDSPYYQQADDAIRSMSAGVN